MILRSLTRHVRDQNWFAVGLDFIIVVVGVFIGIQVANWNEDQRERQRQEMILDRVGNRTGTFLRHGTERGLPASVWQTSVHAPGL